MDDSIFATLFILIFDGAVAFGFAMLAKKKGYNPVPWGILGFFFPILYLVIILLPKRNVGDVIVKQNKPVSNNVTSSKPVNTKKDPAKTLEIAAICFAVCFVFAVIAFVVAVAGASDAEYDDFKDFIVNDMASAYLDIKDGNNIEHGDEKVYVNDLYELYLNDYFDDSLDFDEAYADSDVDLAYIDENSEIDDDYIVIVIEKTEDGGYNWQAYYYEEEDVQEEMLDYLIDYGVSLYEKAVTNNYEKPVKSERVYVKDFFEKGAIKSSYYNELYNNNKKKFKNDYVQITAKGVIRATGEYFAK